MVMVLLCVQYHYKPKRTIIKYILKKTTPNFNSNNNNKNQTEYLIKKNYF
jgi:hypothetical protein